jgi:hypothetical protein
VPRAQLVHDANLVGWREDAGWIERFTERQGREPGRRHLVEAELQEMPREEIG